MECFDWTIYRLENEIDQIEYYQFFMYFSTCIEAITYTMRAFGMLFQVTLVINQPNIRFMSL